MIHIHDDATDDLLGIKEDCSEDFFKLLAFLEQLKNDSTLMDGLLDHGFGEDKEQTVSVKKWFSILHTERFPVWRLRAWELEAEGLKYRIIYLYYWPNKEFIILAIVHRGNLDYDDIKHPIRQRIIQRIQSEYSDC